MARRQVADPAVLATRTALGVVINLGLLEACATRRLCGTSRREKVPKSLVFAAKLVYLHAYIIARMRR